MALGCNFESFGIKRRVRGISRSPWGEPLSIFGDLLGARGSTFSVLAVLLHNIWMNIWRPCGPLVIHFGSLGCHFENLRVKYFAGKRILISDMFFKDFSRYGEELNHDL